MTTPAVPKAKTAPRRVSVLGSTGSVGCNTIDLIRRHEGSFVVEALTAKSNVKLLSEQARALKARMAVVSDETFYDDLKDALAGTGIEAAAGNQAVTDAAARPADWVMASIVGVAGLKPTLAAVKQGAVVALANKECLVSAGDVMLSEIRRNGATLLPVDSEHSAIFQVFNFDEPEKVRRIILTASGGPFCTKTSKEMAKMSPAEAVSHPNWDMGAKISVDSATMMNKGLELIEAYHLFPVTEGQIEILVHPQSVIHSMVDYVDGSVLAQLGTPDMRTPIAYALGWPSRMEAPAPSLKLEDIATLTFEPPDFERFPALKIARQALKIGGGAPTILNAANEVAVQCFLTEQIGFLDIARVVEETLERCPAGQLSNLSEVIETDKESRKVAEDIVTNYRFGKN